MSEATSQIIEPCSECGQLIDVSEQTPLAEVSCPTCGAALRVRKQFNNFTLIELIGEGGMGSVFRATDLNLQRQVALKILKKEAGSTESDWKKLEEEARITASINHPHVVKVYSFGEDHGQFYLAMELVGKGSLDDFMRLQTRVAEAQVLEVGMQTAEGLAAAYDRGLLHRDVKPGNILFADAHTAKIVDFGLAVLLDEDAQERGEIWGTPYYIAPEKLDNRPEDFRSDIYSLGGTLFHAVAGRPPFEATTASMVALKHIKSQAVSLQAFAPEVSSETAYVINRMLNKNPDERYASYEELIGHLSYARDKLIGRTQGPIQKKERVQVESEKTRTVVGLVWMATFFIVVAAAAALFVFRKQIFPDMAAEKDKAASEAPAADASALNTKGREAFVAGRFKEAAESFASTVAAAGERQPMKNWALANQGLALVMGGEAKEAATIFGQLKSAGLYSMKVEDQGLANFFVELGRLMSGPKAIAAGTIKVYSLDNYEAFAALAYGLRDWQMGDIEQAGPILEAFDKAAPQAPYEWIGELKPVIAPYLDDFRLYKNLALRAAAASDPAAAGLAIEIEQARQKTTTGSRINELLDALAAEVRAKLGAAPGVQ